MLFFVSKIERTVGKLDRETKLAVSAKWTFLSWSSPSAPSSVGGAEGKFTTQCHHWEGTNKTSPASHIVS